jgi:hypothetical protein
MNYIIGALALNWGWAKSAIMDKGLKPCSKGYFLIPTLKGGAIWIVT